MTINEFVSRAVGVPWVRWRADWQACDCFGLVILYYREVLGIELGEVPQTGIADGFFGQADKWKECGPEAGSTVWMAWRNGAPTHVGVLFADGLVIHSEGGEEIMGSVRVSRLDVLKRAYGQTKFVRYITC